MTGIQRWGIYDVKFPYEDKLESKVRPTLNYYLEGDNYKCAKITSTNRYGEDFCVPLANWSKSGLNEPSFLECDRVHSVLEHEFIKHRGKLHYKDITLAKKKLQLFGHMTYS